MAAIVSVVCAPNPRRRPPPPSPPSLSAPSPSPPENHHPADHPYRPRRRACRRGKLLENSRSRSEILFPASRRPRGRARSFFCFVFRGTFGCPSDLCLFCRSLVPPLPPFSSRLLFRNVSSPPSRSSRFPRAARGMNFVSRAPSFISQTFRPPYALSPIPPSMYRLFRIRVLASRCITALPTSGSPYRAMCILSALIFTTTRRIVAPGGMHSEPLLPRVNASLIVVSPHRVYITRCSRNRWQRARTGAFSPGRPNEIIATSTPRLRPVPSQRGGRRAGRRGSTR